MNFWWVCTLSISLVHHEKNSETVLLADVPVNHAMESKLSDQVNLPGIMLVELTLRIFKHIMNSVGGILHFLKGLDSRILHL